MRNTANVSALKKGKNLSLLCNFILCLLLFYGCSSAKPSITTSSPTTIRTAPTRIATPTTYPTPTTPPVLTPTPTTPSVPTNTPTPTPTPIVTPTSMPIPTATALPLPSGNLPGWYSEQSRVWSGYSAPKGGILGVRAQWIEPQVSGGPNSNLFIWIGVGGWDRTVNELVQIGTLAYTDSAGNTEHHVWYETVPELSQVTSMLVYPGDTISACMQLKAGSHQQWNLSLSDLTRNTAFTIPIDYPSSQVYADFIAEDPHLDSTDLSAPVYPFQRFTSVKFTGAQVQYADGWHSIGSLQMMQITMVQDGKTLATPGPITLPDSFSITRASS